MVCRNTMKFWEAFHLAHIFLFGVMGIDRSWRRTGTCGGLWKKKEVWPGSVLCCAHQDADRNKPIRNFSSVFVILWNVLVWSVRGPEYCHESPHWQSEDLVERLHSMERKDKLLYFGPCWAWADWFWSGMDHLSCISCYDMRIQNMEIDESILLGL